MSTINNIMTIDANGEDVILDGLKFSGNARIKVISCASLVIKNCTFSRIVKDQINDFIIQTAGSSKVRFIFENNLVEKNAVSKVFDFQGMLLDGSEIISNYFEHSGTTSILGDIYTIAENSLINISRNKLGPFNGKFRIMLAGKPNVVLNVENNNVLWREIIPIDDENKFIGIIAIEPLGLKTETYSNMTIYLNENVSPAKQLIYAYSPQDSSKSTILDSSNVPITFLNGERYNIPIYYHN